MRLSGFRGRTGTGSAASMYENEDVALDESGFLKAIHLGLRTDDVDDLRRRRLKQPAAGPAP